MWQVPGHCEGALPGKVVLSCIKVSSWAGEMAQTLKARLIIYKKASHAIENKLIINGPLWLPYGLLTSIYDEILFVP